MYENKIYNDNFLNHIHNIDRKHMIVTDPPYNINFKYNKYKDKKLLL